MYRGSTSSFRAEVDRDLTDAQVSVLVAQCGYRNHVQFEVTPKVIDERTLEFELSRAQTLDFVAGSDVKFQLKVVSGEAVTYSNVRTKQIADALDNGCDNTLKHSCSRSRDSTCACDLRFSILAEFVKMGEYETYDGDVVVTPSWKTQTLATSGKVLMDDVTVNPIEISETPNAAGGLTLMI